MLVGGRATCQLILTALFTLYKCGQWTAAWVVRAGLHVAVLFVLRFSFMLCVLLPLLTGLGFSPS